MMSGREELVHDELLIQFRKLSSPSIQPPLDESISFQGTITTPTRETAPIEFRSPMRHREVEEFYEHLPRANMSFQRRFGSLSVFEIARHFGGQLLQALQEGPAGRLYEHAQALAQEQRRGLRLRLALGEPQLALLPWEFLYDSPRKERLVLSPLSSIVRQASEGQPLPTLEALPRPLRILIVVTNPEKTFAVDAEQDELRRILQARGDAFEHTVLPNPSQSQLRQSLAEHRYHLLHFVGDGVERSRAADQPIQPAPLVLHAEKENQRYLFYPHEFQRLLENRSELRMVFLSGCGMASLAYLLAQTVPAVLAFNADPTESATAFFTDELYGGLAEGELLESAVTRARQKIDTQFSPSDEWGLPVLYLKTAQGRLLGRRSPAQADILEHNPAESAEQLDSRKLLRSYERDLRQLEEERGADQESWPAFFQNYRKYLTGQIEDLRTKLNR